MTREPQPKEGEKEGAGRFGWWNGRVHKSRRRERNEGPRGFGKEGKSRFSSSEKPAPNALPPQRGTKERILEWVPESYGGAVQRFNQTLTARPKGAGGGRGRNREKDGIGGVASSASCKWQVEKGASTKKGR